MAWKLFDTSTSLLPPVRSQGLSSLLFSWWRMDFCIEGDSTPSLPHRLKEKGKTIIRILRGTGQISKAKKVCDCLQQGCKVVASWHFWSIIKSSKCRPVIRPRERSRQQECLLGETFVISLQTVDCRFCLASHRDSLHWKHDLTWSTFPPSFWLPPTPFAWLSLHWQTCSPNSGESAHNQTSWAIQHKVQQITLWLLLRELYLVVELDCHSSWGVMWTPHRVCIGVKQSLLLLCWPEWNFWPMPGVFPRY